MPRFTDSEQMKQLPDLGLSEGPELKCNAASESEVMRVSNLLLILDFGYSDLSGTAHLRQPAGGGGQQHFAAKT